jgi:hypothetical protein
MATWSLLLLLFIAAGVLVVLAGIGLVLFLVLRKKQPPRGFDVLSPKEKQAR